MVGLSIVARICMSMTRLKGKTLVLLLTMMMINMTLATSLLIKNAILDTNNKIQSEMDPVIVSLHTLEMNDVMEIAQLPEVEVAELKIERSLQCSNNEVVGGCKSENLSLEGTIVPEVFQVKIGQAKLIEGRGFTDEEIKQGKNVAIVTKKFADFNHFNVGQILPTKIEEKDAFGDGQSILFSIPEPLEIIGIIDLNDPIVYDENPYRSLEEIRQEQIEREQSKVIVPTSALLAMNQREEAQLNTIQGYADVRISHPKTAIIKLKDAKKVKQMVLDLRQKYEKILLISDYNNIEQAIALSDTMIFIADIIFWSSIMLTFLILTMLSLFFVQTRKNEIGLLLALGEAKVKICIQIFLEIFVLALIGITLSIGLGFTLSQPISRVITENEIATLSNPDPDKYSVEYVESRSWEFNIYAATQRVEHTESIKNMRITMTNQDIGLIYTVTIPAICVATLAPMVLILRIKPKKLLI